jgi:phenylalanyl-tRNA synthetase beta chain
MGQQPLEKKITVRHSFITRKLGIPTLNKKNVIQFLEQLGFRLAASDDNSDVIYTIDIPTFRAKDLNIAEDIVEEVGRLYGYDAIEPALPLFTKTSIPVAQTSVTDIKKFLVSALLMHEVQSYAFFNEAFIQKLDYDPVQFCTVISPVSENWRRLVTTLVPHLLEAVNANHQDDEVRFFEWARVWTRDNEMPREQQQLAGIFWHKSQTADFYTYKSLLCSLFAHMRLTVSWHRPTQFPLEPWYDLFQCAQLMCQGTVLGYTGVSNMQWIGQKIEGSGFIFTLNGDALLHEKSRPLIYHPTSRYQAVIRDISIIVSLNDLVGELEDLIVRSSDFITMVQLVDSFENSEWQDKKGLTFRITLHSNTKTLTKQEIDDVCKNVCALLGSRGAIIR